jgi:hypothetical protein
MPSYCHILVEADKDFTEEHVFFGGCAVFVLCSVLELTADSDV